MINPDHQKELDAIEVSLEKVERKLARFNSYLQGDEEPPELLIQNIRKAEKEQKELLAEKEEILARNGAQQALQGGIPVIEYQEPSRESNVRLRDEIHKRIDRIDLTFGAEILTPDNQTIANVTPGRKQVMAKITFANGATRWAVINNDQAVLLS